MKTMILYLPVVISAWLCSYTNMLIYVNLEIFVNFIFAKALKDIFATLKNSRLGHDLIISANDRVISSFISYSSY